MPTHEFITYAYMGEPGKRICSKWDTLNHRLMWQVMAPWLAQRNAAHARSLIARNPTWPKGCASSIIQAQRRQDHPGNALTHNVRSFYGLPNFPMIPDGWIAAQQRRQLHSCPRCSLPLADRSRFRCVFSVPLDKGGSASVDNLILICRSCSMAPVGRLRTNDDDPISWFPDTSTADAIGIEFETDVAAAWNLSAVSIRHRTWRRRSAGRSPGQDRWRDCVALTFLVC